MSTTPESRRDHCIKSHKFPHDFRFDKASSRKKSPSADKMDTTEDSIPKPAPSKAKLTTFSFGHRKQKVFSGGKKKDPIETMNVDLKESLPEI